MDNSTTHSQRSMHSSTHTHYTYAENCFGPGLSRIAGGPQSSSSFPAELYSAEQRRMFSIVFKLERATRIPFTHWHTQTRIHSGTVGHLANRSHPAPGVFISLSRHDQLRLVPECEFEGVLHSGVRGRRDIDAAGFIKHFDQAALLVAHVRASAWDHREVISDNLDEIQIQCAFFTGTNRRL